MNIADAALNKLKEAYHQNEESLYVTVTRSKPIDLSACKTEGDTLILAFTDGTEESIHNVWDYHYTLEHHLLSNNEIYSEMIVEIEGEWESVCACGEDVEERIMMA